MNRRRFLRLFAGTGTLGIAGCGDTSSGGPSPSRSTATTEPSTPGEMDSPSVTVSERAPDESASTPHSPTTTAESTTETPDSATTPGSLEPRTPVGSPPVARINATPTEGPAPLTVTFDGRDSTDPDGEIVRYIWLFKDMRPPTTGPVVEHTFTSPTTRAVELVVVDDTEETARATVEITISSSDG